KKQGLCYNKRQESPAARKEKFLPGEGKSEVYEMEQMSLFDDRGQSAPLATRLRPDSLEDFAGQEHLLGKGKILRQLIEKDQISSMIFWGPPGVGKTTLASIIAGRTRAQFINFSAVTSGIKEI